MTIEQTATTPAERLDTAQQQAGELSAEMALIAVEVEDRPEPVREQNLLRWPKGVRMLSSTRAAGRQNQDRDLAEWLDTITLDRRDSGVAVIRGAIDESGTHQGARAMCVAACVGTSTQWRKLREIWDAAATEELGAVEKYHAKEAACDSLNYLLAGLIVRHMDWGVVAVIREADFTAAIPQPTRSFFGSAYKIGVEACLSYVSLYYRRQKKVAYLIEAGHKNEGAVRSYLTDVVANPVSKKNYGVQSVTWVGKEEAMIHPADLIAHETAACVDGKVTPLLQMLRHKVEMLDLDRSQLEAFAADALAARRTIKGFKRQVKKSRVHRTSPDDTTRTRADNADSRE